MFDVHDEVSNRHPVTNENEHDGHWIKIRGILQRDASRSSRGWWVAFLRPWWPHAGARLNELPLRVRLPQLDEPERARLCPGAAVDLKCRNFERPRLGASWWGALGVPLTVQQANAQSEPVLLRDRMFGTLALDRRANAFVGRRRGRFRYQLRIERAASVDDRDSDRQEVERARAVVRSCEVEMGRIHGEVAARARRLYNKRWRCDREQLSREQVAHRLRLASLTVCRGGELQLSFSDGDLFYGYSINVSLRSSLRLRLVAIGVFC